MLRHYAPVVFAALTLNTLAPFAAPVAAAPIARHDILSGTWRVSRACLTGCITPAPVTKVVHLRTGNVYVATGGPTQVLYQMGMQVLVHSARDSSLLTISRPGQRMDGSGVGADGSTFNTTWTCVAPPNTAGATSGARIESTTTEQPRVVPGEQARC